MTSAATATPTNEQIAELNGWRSEPNHDAASGGPNRWWQSPDTDVIGSFIAPPDYLNDPGTLGEWNELLARNGWTYAIDASAPEMGILCTLFLGDEGEMKADEETELKAKWIAAYRAAEATRE